MWLFHLLIQGNKCEPTFCTWILYVVLRFLGSRYVLLENQVNVASLPPTSIFFSVLSLYSHFLSLVILSSTMTKWFSGTLRAITRCKEVLSMWILAGCGGYAIDLFMKVVERIVFAQITCFLAVGGSIMGIIAGAIRGHTTEAGFLDGACKGAVTGAIAALELLNFAADEEPLPKIALFRSLLNGKLFMEWICPAVAQAYQCHINAHATTQREESDIYSDTVRGITAKGMAWNIIQKLPVQQFSSNKMLKLYNESCCSICLQDFEDEEFFRKLPKCGHFFHLVCIDKWLVQQGSCPMCRIYVPHL